MQGHRLECLDASLELAQIMHTLGELHPSRWKATGNTVLPALRCL